MTDDIEINIKIIPIDEEKNEEKDEMLKHEILRALSKSIYRDYEKERLEEVTTLTKGSIEELPLIFKKIGVGNKQNNRYKNKYNKKDWRRR